MAAKPAGNMMCACCRAVDCDPAHCETDSCGHHDLSHHCHCEYHMDKRPYDEMCEECDEMILDQFEFGEIDA